MIGHPGRPECARNGLFQGRSARMAGTGGRVIAPARIDTSLRAGTVFMTLHFQDEVATNRLTIDVSDPKSGTAEFKACAVRVERAHEPVLSRAK